MLKMRRAPGNEAQLHHTHYESHPDKRTSILIAAEGHDDLDQLIALELFI